ncbi:hypothetical protein [Microcoleus sp. B9-D4]|uniref:hypothetical protein n=1 Tax=Microcoleus sp. B9-D4 TaxID=2818711 RepID=UPI002FD5B240
MVIKAVKIPYAVGETELVILKKERSPLNNRRAIATSSLRFFLFHSWELAIKLPTENEGFQTTT